MLGIDTRGAIGGGAFEAVAGAFGGVGALGAIGAFAACGRNSDEATRTAGSAAGALPPDSSRLPDGVLPDFDEASFAIRKF